MQKLPSQRITPFVCLLIGNGGLALSCSLESTLGLTGGAGGAPPLQLAPGGNRPVLDAGEEHQDSPEPSPANLPVAPTPDAGSPAESPPAELHSCPNFDSWLATAAPTPPSGHLGVPDEWLLPPFAIDRDPATRYSSGQPKFGAEWFKVDLGTVRLVGGVVLKEPIVGDRSRAFGVYVSLDDVDYELTGTRSATGAPPETDELRFTPTEARYVRVEQRSVDEDWWSIHELNVLCDNSWIGEPVPAADAGGNAPHSDPVTPSPALDAGPKRLDDAGPPTSD